MAGVIFSLLFSCLFYTAMDLPLKTLLLLADMEDRFQSRLRLSGRLFCKTFLVKTGHYKSAFS